MAKTRIQYHCSECGASHPKWSGQCGDCGAWNTLVESLLEGGGRGGRFTGFAGEARAEVQSLDRIPADQAPRVATGIGEVDRVLGGGLVPGGVVLIGGDPGIGKSTLLLQVQAALAERLAPLYVTGEESLQQIALRARRLGLEPGRLECLTETCAERILAVAAERKPDLLVIDSIQTIYSEALESAPGSVSQVREAAAALVRHAKRSRMTVLLVGHVTKEGGIAGPRVLEHMVDAVLYFEGDGGGRYRVIRALKNRFGAVNELGIFAMSDNGLKPVANPSAIFLSGHRGAPGSAVTVLREGTRPLLVEVQALVADSSLANPRRVGIGLETSRLAMLLAVLSRHTGLALHDQDVFINAVGGLRLTETGADLPVLAAIVSSFRNRALPRDWAIFGEVGLAGEIRPVFNGEERLKEAAEHGFKRAVIPRGNRPRGGRDPGLEVRAVDTLAEALDALFEG